MSDSATNFAEVMERALRAAHRRSHNVENIMLDLKPRIEAIFAPFYNSPDPSAEPVAWLYEKNFANRTMPFSSLQRERQEWNVARGWTETPLYRAPALCTEAAEPQATPTAADVLRFIDMFAGQENVAEEVCDFVQKAARLIDQGATRQEWLDSGPEMIGLIEWLEGEENG